MNRWILQPRPNPAALLRLFCFPHAGGGAYSFRAWPNGLPREVEVCPVLLPGRETRMKEPAFSNVFPMIDELAPAMATYLDKPFALFGHSMGAVIAFELARRLRREHQLLPECLFVSARVAPHISLERQPIHTLPDAEFRKALVQLNGTPADVLQDDALMQLIMPLLRADFAIHEAYAYTEDKPLECPLFAFGGLQDQEASRDGIDAWKEHTAGHFTKRMLPGDHFFINTAQALFLQLLSQELYPLIQHLRQQEQSCAVTSAPSR